MQLNAGLLRRHSTSNRTQYPQSSQTSPSYTSIPLIEEGSGRGNENYGDASLFHKAVSVIWPYFRYEPLSRVWVFVVLVLAAAHTSLSVVTSFAERDLTTALATKNQPEFFQAIMKFVGIIVMAVPLQASYYYVRESLQLRWRSWLTSHLMKMYFSNDAFYNLKVGIKSGEGDVIKIDNPDQRICEDAASFTSRIVELSLTLFRYTISTVSFIGILYGIAPELVIVLLFYAFIGTYGSIRLFGKTLASLAYDTSRKEGNLRYGLVRIQEHTESIASSRGGARELEVVMAMLVDVVEVLGLRIKWNCKLEVYSSIYSYLTLLMPTLVVSPRYFRGEIELGVVTQAAIAFSRIMDAASIVVDNLGSISALTAEIVRLHDLLKAMKFYESGDFQKL